MQVNLKDIRKKLEALGVDPDIGVGQLSDFLKSLEQDSWKPPDAKQQTAEVKALHDTAKKVIARLEEMKVGARHTGAEFDMINKIHDLAVGLGAECECAGESKSTDRGEQPKGENAMGAPTKSSDSMVGDIPVDEETQPEEVQQDGEQAQGTEEPTAEAATEDEQESDGDGSGNQKALSLWEIESRAWDLLYDLLTPQPVTSNDWWLVDTYPDYAIVEIDGVYWKVPYDVSDTDVTLSSRQEWTQVASDWVEAKHLASTTIAFGDAIKALGDGKVGGYLVRFTTPDDPDLVDDYFDASTDYGPHQKTIVYYDHGLDKVLGVKRLGGKSGAMGELNIDEVGVWVEAQLDLRDEYEKAIYGLAQQKKLGWSSGTATHLMKRVPVKGGKAHHITNWPLGLDASMTPTPAEPRNAVLAGKNIVPLKVYQQQVAANAPSLKALLKAAGEAAKTGATAEEHDDADPTTDTGNPTEEDFPMNKDEMKALFEEVVDEKLKPVVEDLNSVKTALHDEPPTNGVGFTFEGDGSPDDNPTFKAFYQTRFGGKDDNEMKHVIMNEVTGGNYKQFVWQQNAAFAKYLRSGTDLMDTAEVKLLKKQVFAPSHIMHFIQQGEEVKTIKDTMVEAQGSLGGFAVPPNMQENIAKRLPGLTAVRGNGARVIVLTRGNSTDVPKYSGGDDRYVGNLRGQWGSETQSPAEQNATLEQDTLVANVYTYKIPMSQSLVEDAANLVDLVEMDIQDTMAIDEDDAFLIGDGAGKPLGILPGGSNTHSLNEVVSLAAAALTTNGIKKLKRGVATQYRGRGTWVANSDTYSAIEILTVSGTGSDFAFPDLSEEDILLRRPTAESEAMPDIAAGTYPIIFGDMGAYWIVERPGLTVARFQDSNTGINKIELHVRKRVGGRPVELWKLAVQKVAAS